MRKLLFLIILGIILVVVGVKLWGFLVKVTPTVGRVVFHPNASIKEENGKTNILILGIGGGTHDGPDLTDTIILASIDWTKDRITLISIPRDLWVPDLTGAVKKINSAYADGQENNHKGLVLTKSVVQKVTGVQIHYGLRVDFSGFVKAVDEVGGLDITVERTLDDYVYPITGQEDNPCDHSPEDIAAFTATTSAETADGQEYFSCRYKHLHFDKGSQHMDGETALEYVRSRHAIGEEGSDFARSRRQQLVIEAFRNKLITSALFNPTKIINLYNIVKESIDTDITDSEVGLFLQKLPALKSAKIQSAVIDYGDYLTGRFGLLELAPISSDYDFASVLIPRMGNGDFSEIQTFVQCEITKGNCVVAKVSGTPTPTKKK